MFVDCLYTISDNNALLECSERFDEEKAEAIANAFNKVKITIEVDEDWGFCKIVAVNGSSLKE